MKEILKIIYIAVCSAVCLYPVYRWVKDAVDDIRCSYINYRDSINHSDRSKNKIVKIVFNLYFLFNSGIINMNMYCKYMLKLGGKK